MMNSLREVMHSLRASPGFAFALLITLGLAGLIGLMTLLMSLLGGFMGMAHFTEPSHRVHDLTYGFLFTTAVVGMLAQLRRPSKNLAGMLMALIPWVGLLLAAVLSTDAGVILSAERMLVAAGAVIAAVLHPAGRDFFRSFRISRINWVMLALVTIAAVPLLGFASTNIGLQGTGSDDHAGMGHYGFTAAFSFTVIGVGLLASLRPDGWRLTAWVAGLLPVLLGVTSLVYPDISSSLGLVWALAAIAWGVGFVAAAELTRGAEGPTLLGSRAAKLRLTTTRDRGGHAPG
jgi:CRISPR-associated Cas5-like protein